MNYLRWLKIKLRCCPNSRFITVSQIVSTQVNRPSYIHEIHDSLHYFLNRTYFWPIGPDRLEATWDVSKDQPVIQVKSYENDSDLYDTVCWSLQVQLFDGTDLVLSEIIYLSIENEK